MTATSLRQNVYASLKQAILQCALPPNSELREQVLAEQFSVSKSPVREALLRLEQERLVTIAPRQGYRVAPISVEDAREMFEVRRFLEAACAEVATVNASDQQLASLDRFRHFDGPQGSDAFIRYNRDFHYGVCEACGNRRMTRLAIEQIEQMERMIRFSVGTLPRADQSILVAETRDRRRAAKLVKEHITDAERRVLSGLMRSAVHV
jgi:GntR family transcriptional regulator, rspAB operon transcriptional repressor